MDFDFNGKGNVTRRALCRWITEKITQITVFAISA